MGSIGKLFRNRSGSFAIQFAIMAVPLMVCTGLAIDGGRAFLARYELSAALDAAALAVGSTLEEDADLDGIAQTFVEANFKTPHNGPIALTLTPGEDMYTLSGTVTIDTYFMPIVGQPHVTVSAESEVRKGGANVEVALALDVTQSMSGSKITALKVAAKDLVAEVVNNSQSPFFSRVAIAPWGTNLHVGSIAADLRGPIAGTTAITSAHWRSGAARTITGGNWNKGSVTSVSATWRTGSQFTVSTISTVSGRVRISVTGTPTALANGDTIGLYTPASGSADGDFASFKNKAYRLANRAGTTTATFDLQDLTGAYVSPPAGTTNGTSWRVMECLNTACQMRLSNSGTNNLANGDYVHLSGFGSPYATLNNAFGSPWQVTSTPTAPTSTTAFINVVGPTIGSPNSTTTAATGGTIRECFTSTCEYAITASGHGFADGDRIYISGTSTSGGGATDIDNANPANPTWVIGDVTTNTFTLPGLGTLYSTWSSSGSAAKCYTANCQVRIASTAHGLVANDWVQIASVGGFTGANQTTQVASAPSGNEFYLTGWGPGMTNATTAYTASTGTAQCLKEGCQKYRFLAADNSQQIKTISNCVTERTGAQATTDAAPGAGAWLGRDYAGAGSLVGCNTSNNLTPLTDDKDKLNDAIDDLVVTGSTSGQIGTAWGWYMISENWAGLFEDPDYEPVPKTLPLLNRFVVLMTDGAFNTAHCNGVTTETYAYSSVSDSDRIDSSVCTASDTPFNQAQAICSAIKADDITLYTIGFEVGSEVGAEDFLELCATSPEHAYMADNASELQAAFSAIGKEIAKLRLTR